MKGSGKKPSRLFTHLSVLFLLLMGTLFFLAVPLRGYQWMAQLKYRLFLILAGSFVLLVPSLYLELKLTGSPLPPIRLRPSAVDLCALAYLVCTALSAALSPYPGTLWGNGRLDGWATIALYIALFLLLRRLPGPPRWFPTVLGSALLVSCFLGWSQLMGFDPLGLYPDGMSFYDAGIYYAGQFWGTTGNTDFCAALLAMAAGYFTALLIHRQRPREKLFYLPLFAAVFSLMALRVDAGLLALAAGLLLSPPLLISEPSLLGNGLSAYGAVGLSAAAGLVVRFRSGGVDLAPSRSAVLLALAGLLLVLLGCRLDRIGLPEILSPRRFRLCLAGFSAICILAGLGALFFFNSWPDGFLHQAHELLHGRWDDSFGSGRLYIWRQVWALIPASPLFGGGPDTLAFRGLEGFSRYNEAIGAVVTAGIDAAHNEYLNILVNQGTLALLAYLSLLALSLLRWWKNADRHTSPGGMAALFYLIWAFFGISCPIVSPYLWMALAALNRHTSREEDQP